MSDSHSTDIYYFGCPGDPLPRLERCPFCGGKHEWEEAKDVHWGESWSIVCDAFGRGRCLITVYDVRDLSRITRAWNTRPIEDELRQHSLLKPDEGGL